MSSPKNKQIFNESPASDTIILKTPKKKDVMPMNMYNKDETYFRNIEKVPSLFDVKIPKEDYDHLMQ